MDFHTAHSEKYTTWGNKLFFWFIEDGKLDWNSIELQEVTEIDVVCLAVILALGSALFDLQQQLARIADEMFTNYIYTNN